MRSRKVLGRDLAKDLDSALNPGEPARTAKDGSDAYRHPQLWGDDPQLRE